MAPQAAVQAWVCLLARPWGLGFGVWGLGFRVSGLGGGANPKPLKPDRGNPQTLDP